MAKSLENIAMFYPGDPSASDPSHAFLTYDVVDGDLRKQNGLYEVPTPSWTDSPNTIWAAAVAQIKTNEGIS